MPVAVGPRPVRIVVFVAEEEFDDVDVNALEARDDVIDFALYFLCRNGNEAADALVGRDDAFAELSYRTQHTRFDRGVFANTSTLIQSGDELIRVAESSIRKRGNAYTDGKVGVGTSTASES